MLKDITLGQYFPGDSFIHRLDPRTKILSAVIYIVLIFSCKNLAALALASVFTVLLVIASKISLKTVIVGLKPLIFILVITSFYNIFFHTGEKLVFSFGIIKIYYEGIMFALLISVRIICLLAGTSVILTYTTSPKMLTDGLERLLSPLAKLGVPVHEFSMMMTIALRFIPTLIEETDKIMSAQKARGSDFSSGSIINRAKALVPILIPLLTSSFRRAADLATAMECRCYRGGHGITRMVRSKFTFRDPVMIALLSFAMAIIIILNTYVTIFTI